VRLAIKKRQELTRYSNERTEDSHDKQI
jgi:hypothetical protein